MVGFDNLDNKFFSLGTYDRGLTNGVMLCVGVSIAVHGRDGRSGLGSLHDGNFMPILSAGATVVWKKGITIN